jgi:threonine/homoserine/homoserine lactone efflux protein
MITAMVALVFAWLTGYAHLAGRLSKTLQSRRAARAVNGVVGAALLGLGGTLALVEH